MRSIPSYAANTDRDVLFEISVNANRNARGMGVIAARAHALTRTKNAG